jgi:hypothetical protein
MRSLEAIATPILLFAEGYISAFWDHNLEIRIGFQGQVTQAQGVRWGWEWALHKVPMSPHMPRMCHPVCPGPPLWPITPPTVYMHLCTVIFPLIPFWGVVAGHSHCRVSFSTDCLSYGRCYLCAQGLASLCTCAPVCFLSSPCEGRVRA